MSEENIIIKAMNFAVEKHKGQMYGQHPYSKHLHDVAWKAGELWNVWVKKLGLKEEYKNVVLAVCYLHGVLEDAETTWEELADEFDTINPSHRITDAVSWLTRDGEQSTADYLGAVMSWHIPHYVKICDTLCNLEQSVKDADGRRVRKYAKQLAILAEGLE